MSSSPPRRNQNAAKARRPWFGPKRIGWGIRPQTWQGWAITLGVAVVALVTALSVTGRW